MKKRKRMPSNKAGLPPGTPVHIGDLKIDKPKLTMIEYGPGQFREKQFESFDELLLFQPTLPVTWINIDGLHDTALIEKIAGLYDLHPLTTEDIVNTGQRPKTDDYDDYLYIVLKMLRYDDKRKELAAEQVSVVMRRRMLISFQETEGDVFDPVRDRIRKGKGKMCSLGSDYLMYALTDAIVDHYFVVIDAFSDAIETLEEELLGNPTKTTLETIHALKRHIIHFRRNVWPLRETVSALIKNDSPFIQELTTVYLNDVHDHALHIIDSVESFREILSGMMELYLTTISNRLNEVMKMLTVIATIFIPLTFIVGVYGMNFKYMPELEWQWGYFAVWALMMAIAVVMLVYFKKKSWL